MDSQTEDDPGRKTGPRKEYFWKTSYKIQWTQKYGTPYTKFINPKVCQNLTRPSGLFKYCVNRPSMQQTKS